MMSMPQIKLIEVSVKMPMRKLLQDLWEGTTILSMSWLKADGRARIAIVAAVYLVVRRRRPGESAGQGMHM